MVPNSATTNTGTNWYDQHWYCMVRQSLMGPEAKNGGYEFLETLVSGCLENATAVMHGECEAQDHGVTFNEVSKLFVRTST